MAAKDQPNADEGGQRPPEQEMVEILSRICVDRPSPARGGMASPRRFKDSKPTMAKVQLRKWLLALKREVSR
jgi:hypothetical protein